MQDCRKDASAGANLNSTIALYASSARYFIIAMSISIDRGKTEPTCIDRAEIGRLVCFAFAR